MARTLRRSGEEANKVLKFDQIQIISSEATLCQSHSICSPLHTGNPVRPGSEDSGSEPILSVADLAGMKIKCGCWDNLIPQTYFLNFLFPLISMMSK